MLTVSALAVDCPSQLICAWIFMCSMTKLKEHSREICPAEPNSCWRYRHWYRHRQYSPLRPPYIPLHLHIITITVVIIVTIISTVFCLLWQTISRLRAPYIVVCRCTSQASPTHIIALLVVLGSTYFCSLDKVSGLTLLTVLEGLFHEPKKSIKNRNQIKACAKKWVCELSREVHVSYQWPPLAAMSYPQATLSVGTCHQVMLQV